MKDESHDGCSFSCDTPDPRPWWKRKLAQLWPMNHEPLPDLPEWATDGIVVQLKTEFSFLDRLRILLSGRVKYRVLVACEFPPGQTSAQTQTETRPPEILHPGTF